MEQKYDQEFLNKKFSRVEIKLEELDLILEEKEEALAQTPIVVLDILTEKTNISVISKEQEISPTPETLATPESLVLSTPENPSEFQKVMENLKAEKEIKDNEIDRNTETLKLPEVNDNRTQVITKKVILGNFEANLANLFISFNFSSHLISNQKDFDSNVFSLKLDLLLFSYINKQLLMNELKTNILSIELKTSITSAKISHILWVNLKEAGSRWSEEFTKSVCKGLQEIIEGYDGNVKSTESLNLHSKSERYILSFHHEKLLLFDEEDHNIVSRNLKV